MSSVVTNKNGVLSSANGDISLTINDQTKSILPGEAIPAGAELHFADGLAFVVTFDDGTILNGDDVNTEQTDTSTTDDSVAQFSTDMSPEELAEIEALQALILSGEDPTEELPETAAGESLGNQGGSDFASLNRDASETLANAGFNTVTVAQTTFPTEQTLADDSFSVNVADDGQITVNLVIDENNLGDISGTSQDIPAGSTVTLTLTDSAGNTIVIEDVVVNADGTYSVDDVDLSALVDGDITIVANATDANGNPISANDTEALDATAGAITVDLVIDENNLADISGTSQDIPAGGTVTLTLTDSAGNTIVIEDVVVNADGTYSVDDVDLSALVDGDITIVA
ncbi:retention module-containing protein, partial [Shewanella electrodiphila]